MSVPKDQQDKRQFLEDLATQYKFYGDTRTAFLGRFAPENADKLNNQLVLTWTKDLDNKEQKLQDELRKIYPVLRENGYDIPETQRGRYKKGESPWEIVYEWLWEVEFPEWKQAQTEPEKPSEILKRCVLGLKGNYQEAQQKITEITQHLQTFLKDNSLSITVEEGSIIIIVESSQTDYDQIKKRLIGQEIAGFAVEYVIDEWQDVCRRMLKKQTQLSVNNLLKAQFNRNLIEEELFIDLALVQPKRDRNEQHKQNIDPDRGSQFYTQQEVEKRFAYSEFLQEVINQRKQKNIAIIGEPGAGKTTLLQKLAFWLLQETDDLVIWISLGELGEKPLGDYLQEKWLKDALMDTRDEIKADWEQKFKRGAVWLLLDGLDEMGDTARQSLKFQGWVTQAQLIISCRLNLWQANPSQLQDFKTYLTQPFQDEQMQQFIQRWFRNLSGEKQDVELAESLWSALQTSGKERIKDLCRNPLRLTLLSSIWQDEKGNLPDTTAELYQSFVDYIYKWKKQEFPMKKAERDSLNAGLGELGKASLNGEGTRFRLTHRFVCKYLGEPDENSLFDSALKLGWLNEVGVAAENPRERVYAFYHATFQEYFAALTVDDWDYFLPRNHVNFPVVGKEYRIFESQWKQVILLWLGRGDIADEEKEGFIQKLINFDDGCREWSLKKSARGFYAYQSYFLAAFCIGEFKHCSVVFDIVKSIVKRGFGYFSIDRQKWRFFGNPIQEQARKTISETIRQLAITELIEIIENCPDQSSIYERNRLEAAEILGKIDLGHPKAIATLVQILENSEDKDIRKRAAESLHKVGQGNPKVITGLAKFMETDKSENTHNIASEDLVEIALKNPNASAALLELMENREDQDTCYRAIIYLEQIGQGHSSVIDGLVKVIENTEDNFIRYVAACTLERIGRGNPYAITTLIKLIENSDFEDILVLVARILGHIQQENPYAITTLVQLIENTEDEAIRRAAACFLEEIDPGNSNVIPGFIKVIESIDNAKSHWYYWQAINNLKELLTTPERCAEVVSTLKDCLSDDSRQNHFNRFEKAYEVIWDCAANLPYPEFYQAWHHPPTTPHPEVPDQTPVGNNSTVENLETQQLDLSLQLQNLPIFCLNAYILATETDTSEIAQTLCQLIWDEAFPDGDYPEEVTTASKLREHLKKLKLTRNQPKLNLLLTHCEHPTDELIAFCHKLTNILSIAWLTDKSLEAPLKGFPPHQPNLLSAIQTWLEET
ncbi:HEAT repeat domain-containing protein [Planktothrix rubescens]|uniref:NACHT C-terminal alpha/beta 1 domain-containing protein n=1 Tax=Planktothrix rubescens TaxID=59512 RepID=UPI000414DBEE|nr:HEAT repeat domain-containing protein [Planktothrix rubescens]